MPRLCSSLLAFVVVVPTLASAQWTETDVVRAAHAQPETTLAEWSAADAEAQARGAGLLPDPHVAFERQQLFGDGAQSQDQLRLGWRVPLSRSRSVERHIARTDARFAAWAAEEQRARATSVALATFYEALAAQRRARTLAALAETLDEAVRRARAQSERGELAAAEAGRLELDAMLLRSEVRSAETATLRARAQLTAMLAIDALPDLEGELVTDTPPPLESVLANAHERRLATLHGALDAASEARRAARGVPLPDLEVEGGWLRQRQVGGNGEGYVVAASLVLPLVDRQQATRARAAAAARLDELARAMEQRVTHELRAAYTEHEAWRAERERFASAGAIADTVLRAALARFAAGEGNFVEIVDARRVAVEVAERQLAIDLALRLAELRLREASGEWR